MSGTPSTCRPHGTPGNGGSSWTTPSPATTSASAVRLQARKVRSLANVKRGSGSVPSSSGGFWPESATAPPLQSARNRSLQKSVGRGTAARSYSREPVGDRSPRADRDREGDLEPGPRPRRSGSADGAEAEDEARVGILVRNHRDHVQDGLVRIAQRPQALEVSLPHPPGLAAELAGEADQLLVTIRPGFDPVESLDACPVSRLFGGSGGQKATFALTYRLVGLHHIGPPRVPGCLQPPEPRTLAALPGAAERDGPIRPGRRNLAQVGLEGRQRRGIVKFDASRVGHPGEVVEQRDHTDGRLELAPVESLPPRVPPPPRGESPRPRGQCHRKPGKSPSTRCQGLIVSLEDGQRGGGFAAGDTQKLYVSGRSIKALVGAGGSTRQQLPVGPRQPGGRQRTRYAERAAEQLRVEAVGQDNSGYLAVRSLIDRRHRPRVDRGVSSCERARRLRSRNSVQPGHGAIVSYSSGKDNGL